MNSEMILIKLIIQEDTNYNVIINSIISKIKYKFYCIIFLYLIKVHDK